MSIIRCSAHAPASQTLSTKTVSARQLLHEFGSSKLAHQNLINCYGAYISSPPEDGSGRSQQESDYFPVIRILMELCEGGSLESIARQMKTRHTNVRIGEKVIARLAEGVLKGLDYMHNKEVKYRDMKPSQILVTHSGTVKLCYFGVEGDLKENLACMSGYVAVSRLWAVRTTGVQLFCASLCGNDNLRWLNPVRACFSMWPAHSFPHSTLSTARANHWSCTYDPGKRVVDRTDVP